MIIKRWNVFLCNIWLNSIIFSQMCKARDNFIKCLRKVFMFRTTIYSFNWIFFCTYFPMSIWGTWLIKMYEHHVFIGKTFLFAQILLWHKRELSLLLLPNLHIKHAKWAFSKISISFPELLVNLSLQSKAIEHIFTNLTQFLSAFEDLPAVLCFTSTSISS